MMSSTRAVARDRRDGGRVSFPANSQTGGRIQKSRESGLRDLRWSSANRWRRGPHIRHDTLGEWNTSQALRLDSPDAQEAQCEGGQIVQELNSIREGKYWDDVKGGWLDPVLIRKAREEEMQQVKKHAVYEQVS